MEGTVLAPLTRYSKLGWCSGPAATARRMSLLLGPQDCQASPAGLAQRVSVRRGCGEAFKGIERCSRGTQHGHVSVLSPVQSAASANFSSIPVPRELVTQEGRARSHEVDYFSSYHSSTRHCVRCPNQASRGGWTVPRHVIYCCTTHQAHLQGDMRGSRQPGTLAHRSIRSTSAEQCPWSWIDPR